jgi:hypothetical protein
MALIIDSKIARRARALGRGCGLVRVRDRAGLGLARGHAQLCGFLALHQRALCLDIASRWWLVRLCCRFGAVVILLIEYVISFINIKRARGPGRRRARGGVSRHARAQVVAS